MVKIVEFGSSSGDQASDAMDDGSSSNQIIVTGSNPNVAAEGVEMYRAIIEKHIASFARITVRRYGVTRDLRIRHIGNLVTNTVPMLCSSWESLAVSIFRFWVNEVSQVANTNLTWRTFCEEGIYRRPETLVTPAYCWPGGVPVFGRFHPTDAPGMGFKNLSWQFFEYEEVKDELDTMMVIEPFMVVMGP